MRIERKVNKDGWLQYIGFQKERSRLLVLGWHKCRNMLCKPHHWFEVTYYFTKGFKPHKLDLHWLVLEVW